MKEDVPTLKLHGGGREGETLKMLRLKSKRGKQITAAE